MKKNLTSNKEVNMRNHLKPLLTHRFVLMFFIFECFCSFALPVMASKRFVDNGDGTITDSKTDLMWVAKDNGIPINWPDAIEYCKNLRVGGYSDWRMPTLAELASLFDRNEKNKNGYHTIPLISTTAQSCWASEIRDYMAGRFNFTYGKEYWLRQSYSGPTRVLAVRFNK